MYLSNHKFSEVYVDSSPTNCENEAYYLEGPREYKWKTNTIIPY